MRFETLVFERYGAFTDRVLELREGAHLHVVLGANEAGKTSALNAIGGRHAVGQTDLVENRLVGMKSRGAYETPGGTILYNALTALEHLTLGYCIGDQWALPSLPSLRSLTLGGDSLSGLGRRALDTLGAMPNLRALCLEGYFYRPDTLGGLLTQLTSLCWEPPGCGPYNLEDVRRHLREQEKVQRTWDTAVKKKKEMGREKH